MSRLIVIPAILIVTVLAAGAGGASIIYVDVNGPNDPGSGTIDDPFRAIQDALDKAVNGDVVEIRPGIYTGAGNYNLDPAGRSITIRSTHPGNPSIVAATIVDPNGAGRGFSFQSGEDANCVVEGLTIRNGRAVDDSGGAVYCYESSPTVRNCVIRGNIADLYGGAIFCHFSSPAIVGCSILGNSAGDGGGIECGRGTPWICNCIIAGNTAMGYGGGVDCYDLGDAMIVNCTMVGNSAGEGGGICGVASEATIRDTILWANEASLGPQIALLEHFAGAATAVVNYSDVDGGQSAVHDPCDGLVWGSGNIDADPCFVLFDAGGDPNMWDFHLQSVYGRWDVNPQDWVSDSNTSVCIDAGAPNSDWTGEPWPNGKRVNMGAYGGTSQASMYGNCADFDVDGLVDFEDYAELAGRWSASGVFIEDLDGSGTVDFADVLIYCAHWLWEKY